MLCAAKNQAYIQHLEVEGLIASLEQGKIVYCRTISGSTYPLAVKSRTHYAPIVQWIERAPPKR